MDTDVRWYQPPDYPMLEKWWCGYGFPAVPKEMLPKTGIVVGDVVAGFIYETDSAICWLEWIVGNPEKTKEQRSEALDLLFMNAKAVAEKKGYQAIFTSAKLPALEEKLKRSGFMESDREVIHYVWRQGCQL